MKAEEAIDAAWWARDGVYKRARLDMLDETDAEYASIIEAGNKAMLASLRANGYVVVPVEPTTTMLQDGQFAYRRTRPSAICGQTVEASVRAECAREAACYRAMLAAAQGDENAT